jgi:hypothetical protein
LKLEGQQAVRSLLVRERRQAPAPLLLEAEEEAPR